jgi:hypothetical protein
MLIKTKVLLNLGLDSRMFSNSGYSVVEPAIVIASLSYIKVK